MLSTIFELIKLKNILPKGNFEKGNGLLLAVWLLVVFTVFNGVLRKWVFGAGALGDMLLLIQLILPVFFYILVARNQTPKISNAPVFWSIYFGYLILTALNPMNHTPYHALFGLFLHTGYWLIWLAYLKKGKWMELEKLVPLLILILIIEFSLASLQYALPNTHVLNIFASGEETAAYVGDSVRASGTFSYIGGLQAMIPLFACLSWFMMLRGYAMSSVVMIIGLGLVTAFMTGSRGAVGYFVLYTGVAFLLSGNVGGRIFKLVVQVILMGAFIIAVVPSIQNMVIKSYDNFMYRVETSDDVDERVLESYTDVINFRGKYPLFGVGLGATYQGANSLFGKSIYVEEYGTYEREPSRIVLEGGYILFIFRIVLIIVFLKSTKHLPLLAKVFFLVIYLNITITFNIYRGVFFVLGLMLVDRGYFLKNFTIKN